MHYCVSPGEQASTFEPSTQHPRCREERLDRRMNGLNHRLRLGRGVKAASQALVGRSPAEDGGLKAEVKDPEDESPRLLLTPTRSQGQTHR